MTKPRYCADGGEPSSLTVQPPRHLDHEDVVRRGARNRSRVVAADGELAGVLLVLTPLRPDEVQRRARPELPAQRPRWRAAHLNVEAREREIRNGAAGRLAVGIHHVRRGARRRRGQRPHVHAVDGKSYVRGAASSLMLG